MRLSLVTALAALIGGPCLAADITKSTDGDTYFNRPGASLAAHDADVRECRKLSELVHQPLGAMPATTIYTDSPAAGAIGGALGTVVAVDMQIAIEDRAVRPVLIEDCMVVRGWRVVQVNAAQAQALTELPHKDKAARLAEYVGAAQPVGTVVRTFANEAAGPGSAGIFVPGARGGSQLSAEAASHADNGRPEVPRGRYYTPPADPRNAPWRPYSARPPKPLKDVELGGAPPHMALIVVNVGGDDRVVKVTLERVGPDWATPAWSDGKPAQITAALPATTVAKAGQRNGATLVFPAAPGRWRIASVGVGEVTLSLCFGSPAFEVKEGEVVYAGAFAPDHVMPDMTLEPARAAFPALSTAVDKLRAAEWINGAQGQCEGTYFYVMEAPGRPYLPDYRFGARAGVNPPDVAPNPGVSPGPDGATPTGGRGG
ncbi:hypothetical protein ACO2Q3_00305 [Caulobacter sp. KR2-114]|uniref:hypothetical protein n=1 Tax=Caulobacter sp. KR2-114 TaxID=3400912 RepID=UPI003C08FC6F